MTRIQTGVIAGADSDTGFGTQNSQAIANGVSDQDITSMTSNATAETSAIWYYEVQRNTSTTNLAETGEIHAVYNNSTWYVSKSTSEVNGDDSSGVTFGVNQSGTSLTVTYSSTSLGGVSYAGTIKYKKMGFAI